MTRQDRIIARARRQGSVKASEVARVFRISRQMAARDLRQLVAAGQLAKTGSTRNAQYFPMSARHTAAVFAPPSQFSSRYRIRGLQEDLVFQKAAQHIALRSRLSPRAYGIANYAFTEMLNNAIEHSHAAQVRVSLRYVASRLEFDVIDRGVGVFESLRRKFRLPGHFEAAEHLLKGKQTVDPQHHTGQGIFFTSKIADRFVLESARLRLTVDGVRDDVFLEDIPVRQGTRVSFRIAQRSRRDLKALFDSYSNHAYEFDKTKITVRLSQQHGAHVSRSEAKRLLFGLEAFQRIVLDFQKVTSIGQAFRSKPSTWLPVSSS